MPEESQQTYEILLKGGPLDGRTLPLYRDPLAPPDTVLYGVEAGLRAVYTPRPNGDSDDGPLWIYVYLRTEPTPAA